MSRITNDGLTRSGTGCFIAVPIWQQWATKGQCHINIPVVCHCSRLQPSRLTEFCRMDCHCYIGYCLRQPSMMKQTTLCARKILVSFYNCACNFRQRKTLLADTSGSDWDIDNLKSMWSTTSPHTLDEQILANFDPLARKLWTHILTPKWIFWKTIFWPVSDAASSNFFHALESDQF